MKRANALAGLSREHHTALVLAQRIAKGQTDMAQLPRRFAQELEPHFQAEEQVLLPLLEAAGALDLVAQTQREHEEMRRLVAAIAQGDASALAPFGRALAAHVRFEERELFAAAETLLHPSQLEELGQCLASS
jgi:hemerythrin-like domain-containing protein